MTYPIFNEATWIERLAAALEQVAVGARPSYSPLPPAIPGLRPIGERWEVLHSGYRALAARAKHDPTAAVQFRESRLSVTAEPVEAMAILREHPLVKSGLKGSGTNEGFGFWFLNRPVGLHLKPLVLSLAKLSVKEGGQEAARRLHRFVTALANRAVPAHEITVVHGFGWFQARSGPAERLRPLLQAIAYCGFCITAPNKTIIRLSGRNPANGFPARLLGRSSTCLTNPSRFRIRSCLTRLYSCAASN